MVRKPGFSFSTFALAKTVSGMQTGVDRLAVQDFGTIIRFLC